MEDRRSSFPTHDSTPEPNILDGVYVRTENAPLEVIHKRYYILLLIGIILVGAFSFYAPTGMMRALHCEKRETNFIYTILSEDALSQMSATDITDFLQGIETQSTHLTKTVLPENAVPVLKSYSTAHMTQQNAVFDDTGILICPQEPTNYALYAAKDISYIFALDKAKFRYQVRDDGTFYAALADAIKSS